MEGSNNCSPDQVNTVMSICHVTESRAIELLEASNQSLERAIDIHFHHTMKITDGPSNGQANGQGEADSEAIAENGQNQLQHNAEMVSQVKTTSPQKKRQVETQVTIESFLGVPPAKKSKNPQKKLDSFFGPKSKSTQKYKSNRTNIGGGDSDAVATIAHDPQICFEESEHSCAKGLKETRGKEKYEENGKNKFSSPKESGEEIVCAETEHINLEKLSNKCKAVSPTVSNESTMQTNENSQDQVTLSKRDYPYIRLTTRLAEMADTTKRNAKLQSLKDLFHEVIETVGGIGNDKDREDDARLLAYVMDLILGKISINNAQNGNSSTIAMTQSLPLQVSGSAVSTAIQTVTGASKQQLRQAYRKTGDSGDAAAEYFSQIKACSAKRFFVVKQNDKKSKAKEVQQKTLSVTKVHAALQKIAIVEAGQGSQATRQNLLVQLLRLCKEKDEVRFLVRTLLGNMRLGATVKSLLAGLALSFHELENGKDTNCGFDENMSSAKKSAAAKNKKFKEDERIKLLQDTYNVCPRNYDIALALLKGGIDFAAKHCSVSVGFPIQPMLANPASSLDQVHEFLKASDETSANDCLPAVLEWKYDGVRCQAHWDGTSVKLFSRHLLDNTDQFPDVVQYLTEAKDSSVTSFILDSEIVAVEKAASGVRLLPFQDLSIRRGVKKHENTSEKDKIQVRVYAFDLVYLNGVSLLKLPFFERQATLKNKFKVSDGFDFASSISLPMYDEIVVKDALQKAVEGGAEGLMIKLTGENNHSSEVASRSFGYESGTRSKLWLKLKRDYVSGYADTIDVVPIGAWFGSGRKAQKGFLSPVLFAVYDDDDEVFRSVSRCMSFSDEMYAAMREFYFRGTPYPAGVGMDEITENKEDDGNDEAYGVSEPTETKQENIECLETNDGDVENSAEHEGQQISSHQLTNCFEQRPPSTLIVTNESPPIWFKPLEVFEVSFADLSLSRAHTAAAGLVDDSQGRGIALRFPRFKRRRPDKSVYQATTSAEIAHLFRQQSKMQNKN